MQAWENFLAFQEKELGEDAVKKWLRPLKILHFDACNLYLEACDSFHALWFEEHVRHRIQSRLLNNNSKRIKVHLTVAASAEPTHDPTTNYSLNRSKKTKEASQPTTEAPPPFKLIFDTLDPFCTFENFVPSESAQLPYKVLCDITGIDLAKGTLSAPQLSPPPFNPIYLFGGSGVGKTHLLMATTHRLRELGLRAIYTRAETFTDHVVSAIRAGEMQLFRKTYRNIDALLVDDVQVFSKKAATQEELFHTFNALHVEARLIILSANVPPIELKALEPRLISRFEWGLSLPLELPQKGDLQKIIMRKAEQVDFPLHADVVGFLTETFTSNTKALSKALDALVLRTHFQQSAGRQISLPLSLAVAKNLLSDLVEEEQQSYLTSDKVIHTVADFYGIRAEDILGKSQRRECTLPRQIAMHLCRTQLNMPFMKIGETFTRDHSTVMSSVRQVQKGLDTKDEALTGSVNDILKRMQ